jgi:hypothetical protein
MTRPLFVSFNDAPQDKSLVVEGSAPSGGSKKADLGWNLSRMSEL